MAAERGGWLVTGNQYAAADPALPCQPRIGRPLRFHAGGQMELS
jgi:hypothetical protein